MKHVAHGDGIEPFILLLIVFLFGLCLGSWRAASRSSQNRGESAVRQALTAAFTSSHYHLLNNVTVPVAEGTTQIDHILVSRYGIFVLETKHYTGWIFGEANSSQWMQVIYKKKSQFQNPLHQNYKHVAAVAKILDFIPQEQIRSIVVFTGDAEFKTPRPNGVILLSELVPHLSGYNEVTIPENRMQFCVGRLECIRLAISRQTDIEHAQHLRHRFGDE
jgi:hypothetical protein